MSNVFTGNSGTKGIVYLDMYERDTDPLFILDNTFTNNAGYIDSNVIFIRARTNKDLYGMVPNDDTELFCTGYHFEDNKFYNNFGCSRYTGGVINF